MRRFGPEEQAQAIGRAQAAMWCGVVARFEHLKTAEGLRQADLAAALGVSRSQIHEWLSDPRNMTLKAAGRLLLAMDAEAHVEVQT
ncbi:helix-turn-helix transcriptional regulator [Caulobacter sp. UNC279MFTsu5.1]|uniref:helix-turn-helix domain-containing protein n=1 Tax=Caulobacter sp. UNC279MFTsu5.1 TaxID=1502775 RepID=UPI000B7CAB9F|nr:helix-turn-helix transcriptional regulator [Caulobacter sp. UNC279MFTsu5.1]